jgi:rod shape-determining protein MreD
MSRRSPRALLPAATLLAAVILDLLPLPGPDPLAAWPDLSGAVFFFWTVQRPDLLPPVAVFGLGILADAVAGLPIGVTSVALLTGRALLLPGQRWLVALPWPLAWACFLPLATLLAALRWSLVSLVQGQIVPMAPVLAETGLAMLAYPLVAGLLGLIGGRALATPHAAA